MLTPTGCMAFTCLSTRVLCSGPCNLWQSSQSSQERYPSAHSLLHLLSKCNRAPAMDLGLENISKRGHGHTTPRSPDTLAQAVHCGWNVLFQLLPKLRCHLPQGGPWSPRHPPGLGRVRPQLQDSDTESPPALNRYFQRRQSLGLGHLGASSRFVMDGQYTAEGRNTTCYRSSCLGSNPRTATSKPCYLGPVPYAGP